MYNPAATYRLQFHEGFTFTDFERIISYLQKLGISTVYASPVFEATPGSTHGYDGVNPHRINPEIGTLERLKTLTGKLQQEGIGWLQDIVPNHMAYHPANSWLMDVLELGSRSFYAPFFDTIKNSGVEDGRIMVPFLGSSLEDALQKGELKIGYEKSGLVISYYDSHYPLSPRSYKTILQDAASANDTIKDLLVDVEENGNTSESWKAFKEKLNSVLQGDALSAAQKRFEAINGNTALTKQILDEQEYRLCHWQETDTQINYRRFFTVNGLICLNIQDPQVFEHYHQLITSLVDEGVFQGLRIDHIDGLYDPKGYLENLRKLSGEDTYTVVEKILEPGEALPSHWPIQGNTGYDFLSLVNNLFTQSESKSAFTAFYRSLVGSEAAVHEQIHEKKAHMLYEHMGGELDNLYLLLLELNLISAEERSSFSPETIKKTIGEILIQCPVYRYYGNAFPLNATEAEWLKNLFQQIQKGNLELVAAIALFEKILLQQPSEGDVDYNSRALRFYQRLMQFTGPLMAKGVEDTLMYTYNRFIGHNDVGDAPDAFGISPMEFHKAMLARRKYWQLSLNSTSTHDTKRGEDARARLNVLTDISGEWLKAVQDWQLMNAGSKAGAGPDANDEYFVYQTLMGTYPMPDSSEDDYPNRIQEYLQKALREAKQHTNWTTPNEAYEKATKEFALNLLDTQKPFWKSFSKLHRKVADLGIVNSLAQVLLRFTCPGVPDTYQGTEFWDLSLVDPDNRRPVDYVLREKTLDAIAASEEKPEDLLEELWQHRYDGRIKLWLLHTLLNERKDRAELFAKGYYIPLQVEGRFKDHVFAFARRYGKDWYLVAVPLHPGTLSQQQKKDIQSLDWRNTRILLPEEAPNDWEHLLLKTKGKTATKSILLNDIFKGLTLAFLKLTAPAAERGAGVLLSVTSLPSAFGIGDFGPEARSFARFLSRGKQKYWQLLPLNPTEQGAGHSPYSSFSSMAGNTLLISPELLVEEGLLDAETVQTYHIPVSDIADYETAAKIKDVLFELAWQHYNTGSFNALKNRFEAFCKNEASWLDDFAAYVVLQHHNAVKPWYEWPENYKKRDKETLQYFAIDYRPELDKVKWLQFIFLEQWKGLREYCHSLGVELFGDLPFYVSYDSVDVWANPEIFSLDEDLAMTGVAGVPPDYFSADGQLWGMPTFRWDVLKKQNYSWWVNRLRKNLDYLDLLRIDHFRALADYWEVPAESDTAKVGEWKPGPRKEFFEVMEKELGRLPFVAEDLGDSMEDAYKLRDSVGLPGMRVLQFAFGDHMSISVDSPHNYVVNTVAYTGTHDNNTAKGWYRHDLTKEDKKRLHTYLGFSVKEKNAHLVLGQMAYGSVAKIVIMPVQDVAGLDETARMNKPSTVGENWKWRLKPAVLTPEMETRLREWVERYNRG